MCFSIQPTLLRCSCLRQAAWLWTSHLVLILASAMEVSISAGRCSRTCQRRLWRLPPSSGPAATLTCCGLQTNPFAVLGLCFLTYGARERWAWTSLGGGGEFCIKLQKAASTGQSSHSIIKVSCYHCHHSDCDGWNHVPPIFTWWSLTPNTSKCNYLEIGFLKK